MIITVGNTSVNLYKEITTNYPETTKNISLIDYVEVRNWHLTEGVYVVLGHEATVGDGVYIPNGIGEIYSLEEFKQLRAISDGVNDKVDIVLINKREGINGKNNF